MVSDDIEGAGFSLGSAPFNFLAMVGEDGGKISFLCGLLEVFLNCAFSVHFLMPKITKESQIEVVA